MDREAINEVVASLLFELSERLPQDVQWDCLCESITEWLEEAVAPQCDDFVEIVGLDGERGNCNVCLHLHALLDDPPCNVCFDHPQRPGWERA